MSYNYPSDETLNKISKWDLIKDFPQSLLDLLDYLAEAWIVDFGRVTINVLDNEDRIEYEFATGGWSGNEDLLGALRENTVAWSMLWYSSRRGGLHRFRPRALPPKPEPEVAPPAPMHSQQPPTASDRRFIDGMYGDAFFV